MTERCRPAYTDRPESLQIYYGQISKMFVDRESKFSVVLVQELNFIFSYSFSTAVTLILVIEFFPSLVLVIVFLLQGFPIYSILY